MLHPHHPHTQMVLCMYSTSCIYEKLASYWYLSFLSLGHGGRSSVTAERDMNLRILLQALDRIAFGDGN